MGRHQQAGRARRAHLSLGAASLAGLMCSATYALAAPVAAPVAAVSPVVAPVLTTAAPVRTAAPVTNASTRVSTSCDLSGPPVFGDPAHPNEITNRDCGYVDAQGRERSRDPWIDGQLTD